MVPGWREGQLLQQPLCTAGTAVACLCGPSSRLFRAGMARLLVPSVLVLLVASLASVTALQTIPSVDTDIAQSARAAISAQSASNKTVVAQTCQGSPSEIGYVIWQCSDGTVDGGQCTGQCVAGAHAPYGPPLAVCSGGKYIISRTCMAGVLQGWDMAYDDY